MIRPVFLVLLLLGTAACSNAMAGGGSAEEHYRRGLAALEAGQPRTARVELLNAIKQDPGNGAVRLAQARTYLALRDGLAAEAELERARANGVSAAETHHLMAHAYLLQGRTELAIREAAGAVGPHLAYGSRIRALAHIALDQPAEAAAAFNRALAAGPPDSALWTDISRFRRTTGELAGAIEAADRALAADPDHVDALILRGELTRSQYGLAAALPWFDRALEIDEDNIAALLERAATLAEVGRTKAMLADTRKILSLAPGNPQAYFLQALLAARAQKWALARDIYQRTEGKLDSEPAAMLLAGAIDLETGHAARAAERLGRLVELQPDNLKARRVLAAASWRAADAAGTIGALRPLVQRPDADPYVLILYGKALAKQGDKAAALYLERARDPAGRATAPLGPPVTDSELAALRETAAARPNDAGAQVRLIRALLGRALGEEALDRSRSLQAANPGAPDAHILVGDALGTRGDFAGAAAAYRRAANIAFTEPVALRLIEALRNAGDRRGAAQVLSLFLQQNPQNVPALILAANTYLQARQWEPAISLYERVRLRIGDRDATVLNNLAWAYAQTGDYESGLPLAAKAWSLDRGNAATADTYGWLLFKSGRDRTRGLLLLNQAARSS